jgi:alpha/beta superfamily hydrolase
MLLYNIMSKEIVIANACKEHLVGNLHTADTKDLVIVCHGLGWHKDNELIIALCKSFQKKGLNCFRFNFSGTEQSEGKTEDSYYTKQASDLCSVIDYFSIQGYQIKSILGHSIGATATIIQAAKDRRIASIILIAPRIKPSNSIIVKAIIASGKTLSEAIESTETSYSVEIKGKKGKGRRTYRFSKKYLEELRDIDIVGYLNQIKIPTLILRGTEDDVLPKEEVKEACKANEVVRYIAIKGAGHTFKNSEDKDKLISEILQWYEAINGKK